MGRDPCLGELPGVPHGFATGRVVWKETFPNVPSQQELPGPGREFPEFGASSPQTPGTPVGVAWPSRSFAVLEGQGSSRSRDLGGFGSGKPGKPGLGSAGAGTAQGRLREGDPPVPGSIFSFLAPTAGKHGRDEPPSSSARLLPVFVPVSVPPPGPRTVRAGQDRDVWKGNHRPQARLCPPNPCGHRAAAPAPTAPARSHGGFYTSTPKFWLLLPLKNGGIFVQTRSPPCGKHGQNPSPSFDISGYSSKYLSTDFVPFPSFQGGSRVSETVIRSRNTWEKLPPLLSAYTSSSTHIFESPVAFQLGILLKESLSDVLREVSGCPVTWSISFVSAGLFPGSPGAQGPPPFTRNLGTTTSPGASPPILVFGVSPARLCLSRPGEPRGNSRGAAPELHRASCPSLRRGPRLCCHPVRRGRQRGEGSADTSP